MSSDTVVDIEDLLTPAGVLKIIPTVIGAVCLGIILHDSTGGGSIFVTPHVFFFALVVFAFLVSTFLLRIAYLFEKEYLQKSIFEIIHHLLAFILYFCASVTLATSFAKLDKTASGYGSLQCQLILGFINTCLYLVSILVAVRHFRAG